MNDLYTELMGSKVVEYAEKYIGTGKYNDILLAIEFGFQLSQDINNMPDEIKCNSCFDTGYVTYGGSFGGPEHKEPCKNCWLKSLETSDE